MASKQKNEWIQWLKAMVLAIVIALFVQNFIFATSTVEGDSMEPTLEDGERLIFNKITLELRNQFFYTFSYHDSFIKILCLVLKDRDE